MKWKNGTKWKTWKFNFLPLLRIFAGFSSPSTLFSSEGFWNSRLWLLILLLLLLLLAFSLTKSAVTSGDVVELPLSSLFTPPRCCWSAGLFWSWSFCGLADKLLRLAAEILPPLPHRVLWCGWAGDKGSNFGEFLVGKNFTSLSTKEFVTNSVNFSILNNCSNFFLKIQLRIVNYEVLLSSRLLLVLNGL